MKGRMSSPREMKRLEAMIGLESWLRKPAVRRYGLTLGRMELRRDVVESKVSERKLADGPI